MSTTTPATSLTCQSEDWDHIQKTGIIKQLTAIA